MSALVAQLVIRPPHAHVPVPQGRSACPEVPSSEMEFHKQLKLRHFWSEFSDKSNVMWEP